MVNSAPSVSDQSPDPPATAYGYPATPGSNDQHGQAPRPGRGPAGGVRHGARAVTRDGAAASPWSSGRRAGRSARRAPQVMLRASQINGCGWCVDLHTKDAAAAGKTAVRGP
ncbi:hypothetical protein GCM10010402_77600 [Actinomadura luteofluorescens]